MDGLVSRASMIRLSLHPLPASETSAFNKIRAFSTRRAGLLEKGVASAVANELPDAVATAVVEKLQAGTWGAPTGIIWVSGRSRNFLRPISRHSTRRSFAGVWRRA